MSRMFPKIPRDWSASVEPIQSKVFDNTEGGSLRCRETQLITHYNITVECPILHGTEAETLRTWASENRTNNVYWNDPAGVDRPERWYQCQLVKEPQFTTINTTFANATVEMIGRIYAINGGLADGIETDPLGPAFGAIPIGFDSMGRPYYDVVDGLPVYGWEVYFLSSESVQGPLIIGVKILLDNNGNEYYEDVYGWATEEDIPEEIKQKEVFAPRFDYGGE